ncbi:undecaprenyl-diphosphate phosphatase [Reinekea forsetii]|nr:undecaprenyl-diphosphate phosphatase [Reinekea forsetii]
MSEVQWIVLALIQGLTEFLPISSSAHLLLPEQLLGWTSQGLAFDVAVHLGSLLAVIIYFNKDIIAMAKNWTLSLFKRPHDSQLAKLSWFIILGTIPAVIFGGLFKGALESVIRDNSLIVIAFTTVIFGLLLWYADVTAKQKQGVEDLSIKSVLFIGLAQAVAIIPGTSRSGITMTAGLMVGLKKSDAAKFSFLLSIPIILAAGLLIGVDIAQSAEAIDYKALFYGTVLSFISALACIVLFLKWIEKAGFIPFVIYRLILGAILFFVYFS